MVGERNSLVIRQSLALIVGQKELPDVRNEMVVFMRTSVKESVAGGDSVTKKGGCMTNAPHDSTFPGRRRPQAAVGTKEGGTMKKLKVLLLAGCALALSPGFRTVAAGDQDEIPLSKLD